MIEPKDLELGKGERPVWLEELGKRSNGVGREVGSLFFFSCGSRGRVLVLVLVLALALVRCDAKLRGDPSRRTERQVEQ